MDSRSRLREDRLFAGMGIDGHGGMNKNTGRQEYKNTDGRARVNGPPQELFESSTIEK